MSTFPQSAAIPSVPASADANNLTPPDASQAAFSRSDARTPLNALALAIAVDAHTCIELVRDAIDASPTTRVACRLSALEALLQRLGWTADEMALATDEHRSCFDDDIGWFTAGDVTDAARTLRASSTRGVA